MRKKRKEYYMAATFLIVILAITDAALSCETEGDAPGIQTSGELVSDSIPGWLELPAVGDRSLCFITHDMEVNGIRCRNFSYCWDPANMVARWVAYPLNSGLLQGSSGRTGAWAPDPRIPADSQPILYSSYKGAWQRGHQIPSADRQSREGNEQTFYFTNMTPQNGSLNSGIWEDLEEYVRRRAAMVDTLYVVSGCVVTGSKEKALDNKGKEVTVPVAYYKALLAYRNTKGPGPDYTGIAFWFGNRNYDNFPLAFMKGSMTIADLERKTGVDFFVNLPSVIGRREALAVEENADQWWAER